jgi:transposase
MLGHKPKLFKVHTAICLEDLVPQDNFYRRVEAKVDLSFVRDLVKGCYSHMGRPSIDPVVFFKLQLIMFFEGIRSERQLMEMVNLNVAYRWYIGYDLDEPVPDHSSLSNVRARYGLEVFQRFFEHIVALCIEAGLVWGQELYFDGTKVQANAALTKMVPRFYQEAKQHLADLFAQTQQGAQENHIQREPETAGNARGFVEKYDGTRITSRPKHWYKRKADTWVSPTDPDATPLRPDVEKRSKLGYHLHYVVDGGKARIILAALVTPASIMDNTPMLDMERWVRFRWQLHPAIAVGDTKYGTVNNIAGLEQDGLRAYIPRTDLGQSRKSYPPERFRYGAEHDCYVCPAGQTLPFFRQRKSEGTIVYKAKADVCHACPMRSKCTKSKTGREIHRSIFQEYLDRAEAYRETEAYKKAMRKRQLWPEPLFGEAKQWHRLRQFRLRKLVKVNIEGLITAAGQNIKRLLKHRDWKNRPDPVGGAAAMALMPSFPFG